MTGTDVDRDRLARIAAGASGLAAVIALGALSLRWDDHGMASSKSAFQYSYIDFSTRALGRTTMATAFDPRGLALVAVLLISVAAGFLSVGSEAGRRKQASASISAVAALSAVWLVGYTNRAGAAIYNVALAKFTALSRLPNVIFASASVQSSPEATLESGERGLGHEVALYAIYLVALLSVAVLVAAFSRAEVQWRTTVASASAVALVLLAAVVDAALSLQWTSVRADVVAPAGSTVGAASENGRYFWTYHDEYVPFVPGARQTSPWALAIEAAVIVLIGCALMIACSVRTTPWLLAAGAASFMLLFAILDALYPFSLVPPKGHYADYGPGAIQAIGASLLATAITVTGAVGTVRRRRPSTSFG